MSIHCFISCCTVNRCRALYILGFQFPYRRERSVACMPVGSRQSSVACMPVGSRQSSVACMPVESRLLRQGRNGTPNESYCLRTRSSLGTLGTVGTRYYRVSGLNLFNHWILRPTVSRPVCPGIRPLSGALEQIFLCFLSKLSSEICSFFNMWRPL
jgi:hypothetical protein